MRIKLLGVLVALLTVGAAFGLSPLAHAKEDLNRGVPGPILAAAVDGDQVILSWEEAGWMADNTHLEGGYNLFKSEADGDFSYVKSFDRHTRVHTETPGDGTFRYRITQFLHTEGYTWHSDNSRTERVTVGVPDLAAPELDVRISERDGAPVLEFFWPNDRTVDGYNLYLDDRYRAGGTANRAERVLRASEDSVVFDGEPHVFRASSYVKATSEDR